MQKLSEAEREERRKQMAEHYQQGNETLTRTSGQKKVVKSNEARISLICGLLSLIPISIAFSGLGFRSIGT